MDPDKNEEEALRSTALKNAQSILQARQRAERALMEAKEALEQKSRDLAHSLSMMHATMESSPDGILVTDLSGNVTAHNQRYADIWGIPPEVMKTGKHRDLLKIVRGRLRNSKTFESRTKDIYTSSPPESFDVLELADGRVIERTSRAQSIDGRVVGRVWNLRDVSDRRRADEELRQQRAWFEVTLSSIGDAVITTNTDGRVTFLNPMAEIMTGWKLGEASGQPLELVFNIINENTRHPAVNPVGEVLREGIIVGLANHTLLIAKDGTETAIEDSAAPIRDAAGNIIGVVMVFHDVTLRRKAEDALTESESRKSAILSAALDAIITMDHQGMIVDFNPTAEKIFGHDSDDAVGMSLGSLIIPAHLRQRHLEGLKHYLATGEGPILGKRLEMPALHADGHEFPVELSISRIPGMEPPMFTATLRDITERKRVEQELAAARDASQSANQAKDFFLAALSHELRTPLTPVLALLSSLRDDATIPEPLGRDLEKMRRNVEIEARLIDDLLDLTRVTQGKLALRRATVQISQVIEDAINTCEIDLKDKGLTLVRDFERSDGTIDVDAERITQILWNLLRNSIKFTPAGGKITIRSRIPTAGGNGRLVLEVQDTGRGIEPGRMDQVFDAFQQGDRSITRQFGGLGLGLAISKAIAEAHDGTLVATSEGIGRGCTFTLALPFMVSGESDLVPAKLTRLITPAMAQSDNSGSARRLVRILLVEDHADTAEVLSRLLRRMGHHVVCAATVGEALQAVEKEMLSPGIDLVMSDLGLPDGSGLSLMRELSTKHGLRGIALSGYGMDSDLQKSKAAGFSFHLIKPVDMAVVRATIEEVMKE